MQQLIVCLVCPSANCPTLLLVEAVFSVSAVLPLLGVVLTAHPQPAVLTGECVWGGAGGRAAELYKGFMLTQTS